MENYSVDIVEKIEKYFKKNNWKYDFNKEKGIFVTGMQIKEPLSNLMYHINVKDDNVICYASTKLKISKEKRNNAAEFITRANYGLILGCFEMDFEDGEIRYKINASKSDFMNDSDRTTVLLILLPAKMFERYGEGFLNISSSDAYPKELIDNIENNNVETRKSK